jgi:membrane-bound lytic murein transglycosylase D
MNKRGETMSDRYYDSDSEKFPEEEDVEAPAYYRPTTKKTLRPAWIAIPAVGVGLVLLAMLIVWFWEKPLTEGPEKRLQLLEKRIENLESQVVRLNELNEKWIVLENQNQKLQTALERIERMETSINRRIDELRSDVNALGRTTSATASGSSAPPRSQESSQPAAAPPTRPSSQPAPEEASKTHTVQAGDTLYSISRQYGVTVEQLRDWNDLPDNTIGVGQKLRIR